MIHVRLERAVARWLACRMFAEKALWAPRGTEAVSDEDSKQANFGGAGTLPVMLGHGFATIESGSFVRVLCERPAEAAQVPPVEDTGVVALPDLSLRIGLVSDGLRDDAHGSLALERSGWLEKLFWNRECVDEINEEITRLDSPVWGGLVSIADAGWTTVSAVDGAVFSRLSDLYLVAQVDAFL